MLELVTTGYNMTAFCNERSSGLWFLMNMTGHCVSPDKVFAVFDDVSRCCVI